MSKPDAATLTQAFSIKNPLRIDKELAIMNLQQRNHLSFTSVFLGKKICKMALPLCLGKKASRLLSKVVQWLCV